MHAAARRRFPYQLHSSQRRPGFTLVEMLVVITIIGILVGLTVPVVFNAIRTARNAAIITEIAAIETAIQSYKNKYSDFPVDFTEDAVTYAFDFSKPPSTVNVPWSKRIAGRHIRKISRRASKDLSDGRTKGSNGNYTPAMIANLVSKYGAANVTVTDKTLILDQIDPAEALVFCLRGYSKNVAFPWAGNGGPMDFRPGAERTPIYAFEESRLVDPDFDGFPHYIPPHGPPTPYVYFDSRTYNFANAFYSGAGSGEARAFLSETATTAAAIKYMNAKQFQIICAGLDGDYGGGLTSANRAVRKSYPNGVTVNSTLGITKYTRTDNDNITNFSEAIFEDKFED